MISPPPTPIILDVLRKIPSIKSSDDGKFLSSPLAVGWARNICNETLRIGLTNTRVCLTGFKSQSGVPLLLVVFLSCWAKVSIGTCQQDCPTLPSRFPAIGSLLGHLIAPTRQS